MLIPPSFCQICCRRFAADAGPAQRTPGRRCADRQSRRTEGSAFPGEGEVGDFPVHERRRFARRFVRPEAAVVADHGKEVVFDHPETRNRPGYEKIFLKRPDWKFAPRGKSGIEVSDLFPHIASQADDIAFIRSMHTSHSNHYNATLGMHTGSFAFARPSIGAWMSYGLGTANQNLPSFLVLAPQMPYAGTQVWASDFLPGAHQGTRVFPGPEPVANLAPSGSHDTASGTGTGSTGRPQRVASHDAGRRPAAGDTHQVVRDRLRHADRNARGARSVARKPTTRWPCTA